MNNSEPWAVFLDIDGTLIGDTAKISERNAAAIKKARDAGHYVFINTGRALGNIPAAFFDFIALTNGLIAGSGTYLTLNGKTCFDGHFEPSLLCKLFDYVKAHSELWAVLECKSGIIGINDVPDEWGVKDFVTEFSEFGDKYKNAIVEVIAVGKTPPDDFETVFGNDMRIIRMKNFADCILPGCSKSNGMKTVLKELGIPTQRSIAIGDSENDLDMFAAVGISVAVANAAPEALKAADMITDTNIADGVGKAIEKLLAL